MARGCGTALASPLELHTDCFGTWRIRSSRRGAVLQRCSPDIATTASNDKVHVAVHGLGLSRGLYVVRKSSGGLPALVLCLPLAQVVWQAVGVGYLTVTLEDAFWRSLGGRTFRHETK